MVSRSDETGPGDFRKTPERSGSPWPGSAQETFARTVSWGVLRHGMRRLFTTVRSPVTPAQLAMPERESSTR